jgi:hypothetical protein
MNLNWTKTHTTSAQADCMRSGACVPVVPGVASIVVVQLNKDFIAHDPGGSDG